MGKYCRKYCSLLAKTRKNKEDQIMARITALSHKKIEDFTDSERIELIDHKHHLENIYKQKAEGAFIRSG